MTVQILVERRVQLPVAETGWDDWWWFAEDRILQELKA